MGTLLLAIGLALPRAALGQGDTDQGLSSAPLNRPQGAASQGGSGPLTQRQFDAFVRLTGDEPEVVQQRLSWDAGLVPLAAAAADARIARRNAGSAMVIGGYAVLVLGSVLGGALLLSGITPSSDCGWEGGSECRGSDNDGTVHTGLAIIALSAVAGPALAIPGHIKIGRTTQVEADAIDRYEASARALPAGRSLRGGVMGASLLLPLLSYSF
jgi:hypothetical protein